MKKITSLLGPALVLGLAFGGTAQAQKSLTVVSFGGAYGAAQKVHQIDPYMAKTGTQILFENYTGGVAEIKAQVEAGKIQWDVVDIETIDLERACAEGLLEVIPRDILLKGDDGTPAEEDFIPAALENECGVGEIVWSTVYAYNNKTIGDKAPSTIEDLFDLKKFPGKRALRKRAQVNLEWALLADGVKEEDVYKVLSTPEGQERAFAKLDTIKSEIVWFDSWSQAPQLLNDGGAVMVQSANGRFFDAIKREGKPFTMVWDGNLYDLDAWGIVKGTPNLELALDFVSFTTSTKALAGFQDVAYGPPRKSSMALVDKSVIDHLPSTHVDKGLKADGIFWADYGESLGEKFNEWLLK
ncbi:ABC transporter substrate-binding protein [Pusillimonas sp. MFBS29]|uniref:ABC transporter substrate-binding protein n=1 Tax=Pusillimonas sp. MFBS29 TaxID=2886690 RepID=UPI001D12F034|nr:ABC transporter substrate-binding protein [Pusillimonas sp. MFBS29]MCC2596786.1 ABC transporter substrate-binding protein [Pusillimonas sp. MFBS29]